MIYSVINSVYGILFSAAMFIYAALLEKPEVTGDSVGDQIGANLGHGLGVALLIIFGFAGAMYTVASLIPLLAKIVQYKRGGGAAASIISILFDLIFCAVNAILAVNIILGEGAATSYLFAALFALMTVMTVISFVCNIKILKE
jgi:hypothetical protein